MRIYPLGGYKLRVEMNEQCVTMRRLEAKEW